MTRSSGGSRLQFFAYINQEERKIREERRLTDAAKEVVPTDEEANHPVEANHSIEMAELQERTLRQLVELDMAQQLLCIVYPDTMMPFELKLGLIHLLPQFRGISGKFPTNTSKTSISFVMA